MKLTGVYAPLVTPFDPDESIDFVVYKELIEFLLASGIAGLVPGGTTGEVYALSEAERLETLQFVREQAGGRATLLAGTNAGATRDVLRYSRRAADMGYDGLMVAVPPYSRPTQRELLAHYRDVAETVAIPIVLYNFPWRAGSEVGYEVLDGLTDYPHVIGIKEASGDMGRLYEMRLRYGDRYQIVCGSDDQALDYFFWGSRSWIGGAASCAPRQHVALLDTALKGEWEVARAQMERLLPLLRDMEGGAYTQKVKLGCELQGLRVGPPRRPLLPLPDRARHDFERLFALAISP